MDTLQIATGMLSSGAIMVRLQVVSGRSVADAEVYSVVYLCC